MHAQLDSDLASRVGGRRHRTNEQWYAPLGLEGIGHPHHRAFSFDNPWSCPTSRFKPAGAITYRIFLKWEVD